MKTAELNKSCNKFNHAIVQHDDYEKINIDKKPFNRSLPAFARRLHCGTSSPSRHRGTTRPAARRAAACRGGCDPAGGAAASAG
jgi:hypothetical protein